MGKKRILYGGEDSSTLAAGATPMQGTMYPNAVISPDSPGPFRSEPAEPAGRS